MNNLLKIGMPAGSLADPKRGGNLIKFLEDSGFKTKGYEEGGPTKFTLVNFLYGWDGRPQEFGAQLGIEELDVAISGDDWINERILELDFQYHQQVNIEKVLPLNRGHVKIVGIMNSDLPYNNINDYIKALAEQKELIIIVSEMPYLALKWIRTKLNETGLLARLNNFSVQKYKTPITINHGVVVYETWGKTESKVKNGGADLGVEITQSGSAIRNYGLKIVDTIMTSQTSVYINSALKNNPNKIELLRMFLLNLYGTVNAENKVMIVFNVPNQFFNQVEEYLIANRLFGNEPSINNGKEFTEVSIQVEIDNPQLPIAKIRYDLAVLHAKHINTIPISSSIRGIEAIAW